MALRYLRNLVLPAPERASITHAEPTPFSKSAYPHASLPNGPGTPRPSFEATHCGYACVWHTQSEVQREVQQPNVVGAEEEAKAPRMLSPLPISNEYSTLQQRHPRDETPMSPAYEPEYLGVAPAQAYQNLLHYSPASSSKTIQDDYPPVSPYYGFTDEDEPAQPMASAETEQAVRPDLLLLNGCGALNRLQEHLGGSVHGEDLQSVNRFVNHLMAQNQEISAANRERERRKRHRETRRGDVIDGVRKMILSKIRKIPANTCPSSRYGQGRLPLYVEGKTEEEKMVKEVLFRRRELRRRSKNGKSLKIRLSARAFEKMVGPFELQSRLYGSVRMRLFTHGTDQGKVVIKGRYGASERV
ncbi:hypothetical protein BJ508DRAFT_300857 [Ascobolus immersus RN42]|uniref:Uncharacterized protein n=1 Tax=Ascobolus immersus RN42 TaxID=1160509 RepID=A0A3N4IS91_ASCIM|nr:hypothetical protein BJ508DRAFT_300857 [Ascobolus immersus RN42]